MAELRTLLESMGLQKVRTYIQSGNVVFESEGLDRDALGGSITARIEGQHGFRPKLLLITKADLLDAIASNPFPEGAAEPKTLHFFFLAEPPSDANVEALNAVKTATEAYQITGGVFYLHAPDGIGRSKLAATAERHLGVVTTARNYRTVDKLRLMAS
jgi:uncharacterized protein (DUF1697 family)